MGKAVKKIATVAAVAVGAYYGGKALMGTKAFGSFGYMGSGLGKAAKLATSGVGSSLFGASTIAKLGLGLQVSSYLQQRKYASAQSKATKQAAEEQRRINQMQERVRLVQERRQRLDIVRQQRLQQGQIEAGTAQAGLGMQGTSGYLGSTGAIQTQATANIAEINRMSGSSTALSQASQRAADATTAANLASGKQTMYSNIGTLGQNIFKQSDEIANIFKFES